MRPWAWVRRILALVVTLVFVLGVAVAPAFAGKGSRSFSSPSRSTSSGGSRSFSSPKTTTPSAPSRSFSSPKTTTPSSPSRSFTSPPPPSTSSPSPSYSSPDRSFSSGDRSYSGEDRSFSSQRPVSPPSIPFFGSKPAPTYDTSRTSYPSLPPIVVYGPSTYDPPYWHDWYYTRPWYWRMWHRPVYYGDSGGWGTNWLSILLVGFGIWVLLGVISAKTSRRRRP